MTWITGSILAFFATLVVCAGLLFALKPWRIKGMAKAFINVILAIPLSAAWIALFVGPNQESLGALFFGRTTEYVTAVPWVMIAGLMILPVILYYGIRATDPEPKSTPPMPRLVGAIEVVCGGLLVMSMMFVGLNMVFGNNFDPAIFSRMGMLGLVLQGLGYAVAFTIAVFLAAILTRGSSPQVEVLLQDVLGHRVKYLLAFLPLLAVFLGIVIKLSSLAFPT